ncbi:hypothetical protein NDU88_001910 [Pleurodeles waltl]|uniref:Uncharacterized protein n=1 Tax=Pleurodeles waltl TaxID=8319 RepID=A0AAV7M0Z0_PLEWA|nr:hypothetical protein NDU88_001910 [Pleurodeles waltl]
MSPWGSSCTLRPNTELEIQDPASGSSASLPEEISAKGCERSPPSFPRTEDFCSPQISHERSSPQDPAHWGAPGKKAQEDAEAPHRLQSVGFTNPECGEPRPLCALGSPHSFYFGRLSTKRHGYAFGKPAVRETKVPSAIMTDGERREPFQPLPSDEVRVPIAPVPDPGEEEDEDVGSAGQCSLGSGGSSTREPASQEEEQVPYPALAPTVFFWLKQTTRPRSWCLRLVCNPYPSAPRPAHAVPGGAGAVTRSSRQGPGAPWSRCSCCMKEVTRVEGAGAGLSGTSPMHCGGNYVVCTQTKVR